MVGWVSEKKKKQKKYDKKKYDKKKQQPTNLVVHDSVVVVDLREEQRMVVEVHVVVDVTSQHLADHHVLVVADPLVEHLQVEVGPRARPYRDLRMVELPMVEDVELMVVHRWVVPCHPRMEQQLCCS